MSLPKWQHLISEASVNKLRRASLIYKVSNKRINSICFLKTCVFAVSVCLWRGGEGSAPSPVTKRSLTNQPLADLCPWVHQLPPGDGIWTPTPRTSSLGYKQVRYIARGARGHGCLGTGFKSRLGYLRRESWLSFTQESSAEAIRILNSMPPPF